MAIKFEKLVKGMKLADVHSHRMGNTLMRELGLWTVEIVEINAKERTAIVRWNGNPSTTWYERQLKKLYQLDKLPKAYRDQQERKAQRKR